MEGIKRREAHDQATSHSSRPLNVSIRVLGDVVDALDVLGGGEGGWVEGTNDGDDGADRVEGPAERRGSYGGDEEGEEALCPTDVSAFNDPAVGSWRS